MTGADAPSAGTHQAGRHECGVCWQVYDPALGDPARAVPPGTAFAALPADWVCPQCEAGQHKFLPTQRQAGSAAPMPDAAGQFAVPAGPFADARAAGWAVESALRRTAAAGMAALPISNPCLNVEALGFARLGPLALGAVITPWALLLMAVPMLPSPAWPPGQLVELPLPSGRYDFVASQLDGVGSVLTLSLFSPMAEFPGMDSARAAATAALAELRTSPNTLPGNGFFRRTPEVAA